MYITNGPLCDVDLIFHANLMSDDEINTATRLRKNTSKS